MPSISVSDEVFDSLSSRILNKEWKLGDKIPSESELCKEYHVSRISIRSALQRLQAKGLVITRPGKGSFVISNSMESETASAVPKLNFSKNEYKYFLEFRRAIEFYCVDLICRRGEPEDFENLKTGLELMKNNSVNSDKFQQGDILFHTSIIRGSHNPMFIAILASCIDEYEKYMVDTNKKNPNTHEAIIDNHTRVFNALISRDAKKAVNILDSVIEHNSRKFKNAFSDQ